MNKWIIGIIAPVILGLFLDFFKATNPLFTTVLLTLGIILPILLIWSLVEWNKRSKEKDAN